MGRIVIPIHNAAGQLIAYCGRWAADLVPDEELRYKLPEGFHKSQVLYNLHRVKELAVEEIVVVEGFFSVFWLWQHGIENVVALMGSSLSDRQRDMLVDRLAPDGKALLLFDDDDAGHDCRLQCLDELSPHVFVKSLHLPPGCSQPDEMSLEQIRQLISP